MNRHRLMDLPPHLRALAGGSGGIESRCESLGAACVCIEGMNTNTHDSGSSSWTGDQFLNFDDSPSSKECYPTANDGSENYCTSGHTYGPVAASTQTAFLPSGHSLSYLFKQEGGGLCHIGSEPGIHYAANFTYCARTYRRYDSTTHIPQNTLEQQKILTVGGVKVPSDFIVIQLSVDVGGDVHTRFDGNYFDPPIDFTNIGNISECMSNFCRFEGCLDVSSSGEGRARLKMTRIPPGDGSSTSVNKPVGNILHPEGVDTLAIGGQGNAMYGQCSINGVDTVPCMANGRSYISYNTHFILTYVTPEDRTFWPGAASEVETGGAPSVISPVTFGTISRSHAGRYRGRDRWRTWR